MGAVGFRKGSTSTSRAAAKKEKYLWLLCSPSKEEKKFHCQLCAVKTVCKKPASDVSVGCTCGEGVTANDRSVSDKIAVSYFCTGHGIR